MALCALTMLDGVGDEATAVGGVVLLAVALVLAWLSTHVAERGDHILGTILTVGAHASLIGLGGRDSYAGLPSGPDAGEQPDAASLAEDKPEDAEEGEEGAGGEEQLLDIQRSQRKRQRSPELDEDDEEEEEDEDDEGDEAASITVRLKYLNDTEELAVLQPHDTVGQLKSKYFSGRERHIKLIWQGQLLQDPRRTLLSLNITHNSVLHCHVSPAQAPSDPGPEEGPQAATWSLRSAGLALNSGSLVVPVFVVLLAVVWYFRINYRQFFTAPATVSLVGVTVFFSFLVFGMHGR
ncbi:transmembrane and ubiquitin-like domain-containing protein 2 [Denticeps clupeoides]|uniref:Ubiquitin-like domain-containing protein n=1 Tax=Denticeps clupeoides TaxID=299321 RepID=A0AAY4CCB2_9TELE|nr:transmembrane and ubiquitin-like domain-containing protein 2 [Denticeps clupeoides]